MNKCIMSFCKCFISSGKNVATRSIKMKILHVVVIKLNS